MGAAHQMLLRHDVLAEGTKIGAPGVKGYEARAEGKMLRLTPVQAAKPSMWKRLFN